MLSGIGVDVMVGVWDGMGVLLGAGDVGVGLAGAGVGLSVDIGVRAIMVASTIAST